MDKIKDQIKGIASRYSLQIIYAFGSRPREALDMIENRIERFSITPTNHYLQPHSGVEDHGLKERIVGLYLFLFYALSA